MTVATCPSRSLAEHGLPAAWPARSCALPTVVICDFVSGVVTGLAVAMPIGAVGTYLIGLAARERTATAAAAALGVASVDGAYAIVAALGGAGLQALISDVSGWLAWIAAMTLVAVGLRTLLMRRSSLSRHTTAQSDEHELTPVRGYLSLSALTAVNPATLITFAAVVVGRSVNEGDIPGWQWRSSPSAHSGIRRLATLVGRRREPARPAASRSPRAAGNRGLLSNDHARPGRAVLSWR